VRLVDLRMQENGVFQWHLSSSKRRGHLR
jgi:hypothetical protein